MKLYESKSKISTIALILMLTMTALLVVIPARAQEEIEIPTFLLLIISPNPVGQGQTLTINAFMSKPTPTVSMGNIGDLYEDITIEMVRPDGSTTSFGPYIADGTGGVWFTQTFNEIGNYTFQAFYPGQTLTGASPLHPEPRNHAMVGAYMMPSVSEEVTLEVQEDKVEWIYKTPSLPDEYWTRPIYATNWDWGQLGGSWFGLGVPAFASTGGYDAQGNFNPYSEAPNTAHIMWTKPTHFGGLVGAPIPSDQMSQYTSTSIIKTYFEPIILNGIIYYTQKASLTSTKVEWVAVDLRTGETLWTREPGETGNENLRMANVLSFHTIQEYGSEAYLWSFTGGGIFQSAGTYRLYDAFTGVYIAEILDGQGPEFMMDLEGTTQGGLLGVYTAGGNLSLWNSTELFLGVDPLFASVSGSHDWEEGIQWSVPLPTELNGEHISLSVGARTPEVTLVRSAPQVTSRTAVGFQITAGYDTKTGQLLWGPINQTIPAGEEISLIGARDGVYVLHDKDTNVVYGYSLVTGNQIWGPVALPGNAWSHIDVSADTAYGMLYTWDIGGYVNALDLQTGEIQWNFTRGSAGYDTPFGVYPLWYNDAIADGKIYLSEGTMYTPPIHPARTICINATSGELIWSILSYSGRVPPAIADGHMVIWNSFDRQIYSFGKGPTETAVSIQNDVVSLGSSVLIKGSVTDISSGAEQDGVIERFPNGLPAVADEDMEGWMEYVYMQQSQPADVTGVTVKIEAVDPNNGYHDYGTTTSDADGNYAFAFKPEVEGTYMIIATFEGSESYWRSYSTTYLTVDPAAEETDLAPLESSVSNVEASISSLTTYIVAILALVIIAVVIAVYSMLKSRK